MEKYKRPYKLIALDVDMTLTNSDRDVHPDDREILEKLSARGVHIVLASGRMTHSIVKFGCDKIGFETDVIAYNGAMIWVRDKKKPISHEPLPYEPALDILSASEELKKSGADLSVNCYLDDELYSEKQNWLTDLYNERTKSVYNFVGKPVTEFLRDRNDSGKIATPTKLIVLGAPETNEQLCKTFKAKYGESAEVLITDPEYLEFMKKGTDKGRAILKMMEYYGIEDGLAVTFGDGNNDVPMLQLENVVGVAVNNASDAVKSAADIVAPDSYGGVSACLKQIYESV
jgi:5-amino-6-(5-phospho-D-ribitylamino)uracil phosphatase